MKKVYLKSQGDYISMKAACSDRPNLGSIEKPTTGSVAFLNAKTQLLTDIAHAGGSVPGYSPTVGGTMKSGAGSGYAGGVQFSSIKVAIDFLKKYFQVYSCDKETELEVDLLGRGYRHRNINQQHASIYSKPGGSSVVIVRPSAFESPVTLQEVESYFHDLKDVLQVKHDDGEFISEIHLPGGGHIPIPDWFRKWCGAKGIALNIHDPSVRPLLGSLDEVTKRNASGGGGDR